MEKSKFVKIQKTKDKMDTKESLKISKVGSGIIPGIKNFNAKKYLEKVRSRHISNDEFDTHVLKDSDVGEIKQMNFDVHLVDSNIKDREIMERFSISKEALMSREQIARITTYLTGRQSDGRSGVLATENGRHTVIGYFLCKDDIVRVVEVTWVQNTEQWVLYCFDLNYKTPGCKILIFDF